MSTTRSTRASWSAWRIGRSLLAAAAIGSIAACGATDNGAEAEGAGTAAGQHHEAGDATETDQIDVAALAPQLAAARLATAPYVAGLDRAAADGYTLRITPMIDDMGVHYLNADIDGFDPAKPPILVYVPTEDGPQLGALEWVFPEEPAEPPFPGATYGDFPAACHYDDGTFVLADDEALCAPIDPDTGAGFTFWHDALVTLHVWLWYHNPSGIYSGTNPLVNPFNDVRLASDGR